MHGEEESNWCEVISTSGIVCEIHDQCCIYIIATLIRDIASFIVKLLNFDLVSYYKLHFF